MEKKMKTLSFRKMALEHILKKTRGELTLEKLRVIVKNWKFYLSSLKVLLYLHSYGRIKWKLQLYWLSMTENLVQGWEPLET